MSDIDYATHWHLAARDMQARARVVAADPNAPSAKWLAWADAAAAAAQAAATCGLDHMEAAHRRAVRQLTDALADIDALE